MHGICDGIPASGLGLLQTLSSFFALEVNIEWCKGGGKKRGLNFLFVDELLNSDHQSKSFVAIVSFGADFFYFN